MFAHSSRRMLSSTASAAAAGARPRIVSRRALLRYREQQKQQQQKLQKPKDPIAAAQSAGAGKTNSNPADEKPWPLSVRIAGYAALCLGVPYATAWLVSCNPGVVAWLEQNEFDGKDDSDDFNKAVVLLKQRQWFVHQLRNHFGYTEPQSYQDGIVCKEPPVYVLEGESDSRSRLQERLVEQRLAREKEHVRISLLDSDDSENSDMLRVEETLPSSLRVTAQELLSHLSATAGRVAIEFSPKAINTSSYNDSALDELSTGTKGVADLELKEQPVEEKSCQEVDEIRRMMYTYSVWHCFSPSTAPAAPQKVSAAKEELDYQISKWEYTVGQLEQDMKDVNCTRDIDDMRAELKEAKSELRKYQWRKRIRGIVG